MGKTRPSDRTRYNVQAVQRALDILDCFDFDHRQLSLADLVRITGLNKTTALRLAANLEDRGYLKIDPESARYTLGLRLFELGGVVFSSFSLRRAAARHMSRLQQDTSSTVLLGALIDGRLVYLDRREGQGAVRIVSDIGWNRAPHYGMLGMVLMAWLPPDEVTALLAKYPLEPVTPATVIDPAAFRQRLARIALQGHVVEEGEAVEGIIGVAAPIRDYTGQVRAALGSAVLQAQHTRATFARVVDAVRSAAEAISRDLGYNGQ
ncbi:MAG: IclR family transcriptional regulator [Proteobacteria bacterium]|nr:IclR family transcriptional regulator [Pseudomonadota bacterium]MBU1742207.1 IclR family transcriptional regulator [Pseudomonadota bacterium]